MKITDYGMEKSAGPVFIGVIFNWGLLGALLVQFYIYLVWYHQTDRFVVRYIVYTLLCIEGLQTALVTHTGWEIFASRWGDPTVFQNIPWSSAATPIVCGIVSVIVQLYFCWRIWLLGSSEAAARVVGVVCALLALTQCIAAITYGAKYIALHLDISFFQTRESKVLAIIWLVCTVICDVLITASLVYIFIVAKSHSLAPTGSLLNRLIIQTVQTGAITVIFNVLDLAFFLAYPGTLLDVPFVYILSKLYPNVLLANLNNRNRITSTGSVITEGVTVPGDIHTLRILPPSGSDNDNHAGFGSFPYDVGIELTTSTQESSDRDNISRKFDNLTPV